MSEYVSLSPSGLSGSAGILKNALRMACTLEVGARIVMGKSAVGWILVARVSDVINEKKLAEVALTWKMSSLYPVMYTCVTLRES